MSARARPRSASRAVVLLAAAVLGAGCGDATAVPTMIDCGSAAIEAGVPDGAATGADATEASAREDAIEAGEDTVEAGGDANAVGSCTDRLKNGDETDVDCGGSCMPCGPNKRCVADGDCSATASGCDAARGGCRCDATSKRCVHDHCLDHEADDGETDTDCGGDACAPCANGLACQQNRDCAEAACDALSSTCTIDPCLDHKQDGTETDIDCGGLLGICPRCQVGRHCLVRADCQAGHSCSTDGTAVCQ